MVKSLEELRQSAVRALEMSFSKGIMSKTGNTGLVIIHANSDVEAIRYQMCHGQLSGIKIRPKYILSNIQNFPKVMATAASSEPPEKYKETYLEYIANHSPAAEVFIDKDPKEILKNNHCIFTSDVPGNLMFMALFMFRVVWEKPLLMELFTRALKEDSSLNKNILSLLCQLVNRIEGKYVVHGSIYGHNIISPSHHLLETYRNYRYNRRQFLSDLYSKGGYTNGVDRLFYPKEYNQSIYNDPKYEGRLKLFRSTLVDVIREVIKKENVTSFNNPFILSTGPNRNIELNTAFDMKQAVEYLVRATKTIEELTNE